MVCFIYLKGNWDYHLSLIEFAYNNSYRLSVGMTSYEALYGRKCQTPLCRSEVGERKLIGPKLCNKWRQGENYQGFLDRHKSYADLNRRDIKCQVESLIPDLLDFMRYFKELDQFHINVFCHLSYTTSTISSIILCLEDTILIYLVFFYLSILRLFLTKRTTYYNLRPRSKATQ